MSVSGIFDGKVYFYLEESVDDRVNFREEYFKSGVAEVLERFGVGLVGLVDVKNRVKEVAMFILVQLVRKRMGLQNTALRIGSHMSFTGNSGTGKTLVARRMASVLYKLGLVRKGHLVVATREDLVGQYIGHTAPKTKAVFKKAEGGVLFLDEANTLYKDGNARDYGAEVIEILLQYMERFRGELVVVFAGYRLQMELFFKKNPGLASRVLRHIDFPDYTVIELMLIAFLVCEESQYVLDRGAILALWEFVGKARVRPDFANAWTVESKVASAVLSQSRRVSIGMIDADFEVRKFEVVTLSACDF